MSKLPLNTQVVLSNSGARVVANDGRTVIRQAGHRFAEEKMFVGEKITRIPKALNDWVKKKKIF